MSSIINLWPSTTSIFVSYATLINVSAKQKEERYVYREELAYLVKNQFHFEIILGCLLSLAYNLPTS